MYVGAASGFDRSTVTPVVNFPLKRGVVEEMEDPIVVVVKDGSSPHNSDKVSTPTYISSPTADAGDTHTQKNGKDKSHRVHSSLSHSDDPELQEEV